MSQRGRNSISIRPIQQEGKNEMRPLPWTEAEPFRLHVEKTDVHYSEPGDPFGAFIIHRIIGDLRILASSGEAPHYMWEHVSVSLQGRCPKWEEMVRVKRLFWLPTETVMQLHVPDSDHINCHPFTLHLWRPINIEIPLPPPIM